MRAVHEPEYKNLLQDFKEAEEVKDAATCDLLQKKLSYLTSGNWEPIAKGCYCEVKNNKTEPWVVIEYSSDTEKTYSHIRHSRSLKHPITDGTPCEGLDNNGSWWEIKILSHTLTDVGYIYAAVVVDEASTQWEGLHQNNIRSLSEGKQPVLAVKKEKPLPKREKSLAEVEEIERKKWRELPSALAAAPATSPHYGKSKKTGSHSKSTKKSSSKNKHAKKANTKSKETEKHTSDKDGSAKRPPPHPDESTHLRLLSHQLLWIESELGNVIKKKNTEITIDSPGTYFLQPEIVPNCREASCRVSVLKNQSKGIRFGVAATKEGKVRFLNHVQGGLHSRIGEGTLWIDVDKSKSKIYWRRHGKESVDHNLSEPFLNTTLRFFVVLGKEDTVTVYPPLNSTCHVSASLDPILRLMPNGLPRVVVEAVALTVDNIIMLSNILPILAAAICIRAGRAKRRNKKIGQSLTCCANQ
eukprot:TRINITY_DN10336_c0_g2_i2.p1 TRINITY_DN10336_c0_g2~~TRINITY_DN10336_c0_g2_i2.p1  ORF type:complete len:469 (+),score=81.21 TRINITY_DN10336_c0_g2_i2:265-1671(+)